MPPEPPATANPAPGWTRPRSWPGMPWWPWARRIVGLVFFLLVAWLVAGQARSIAWGGVWTSLRAIPGHVLGLAALFACLTYAVYCQFDLIGRHCSGHRLARRRVLLVTFISYAFNLNLGTLVGGVAFRYRLYGRFGLQGGQIAHVTALSMLTNWIGYCLLAGCVFLAWPPPLPPQWEMGAIDTRWLGALALAIAASYLGLCAWRGGRELVVAGRSVPIPGWRLALLQLAISSLHWSLMASIIFVLLQGMAPYPTVLATLLVAAIAGVIAHVPAGLGVTEAVFVALMGHLVPHGPLLAALLGYRAVYYIAPLLLATLAYLAVEWRRRRGLAGEAEADATKHRFSNTP